MNTEICTCACHENARITHVTSCCHPCNNCGENIRSIDTYKHKKSCLFPIVGLTLEDARNYVSKIRFDKDGFYSLRVVKNDDKNCMVTHDFCVDRVNVEVVDGVVTHVSNFG